MRSAFCLAISAWILAATAAHAQRSLLDGLEKSLGAPTGAAGAATTPGYLGMVPDEELKGINGVRVVSVKAGGPAEKSGLKADDLIKTIDGKPISTVDEMDAVLKTAVAGQKMLLTVVRSGKIEPLTVTLGARPAAATVSDANPGEAPLVGPAPPAPAPAAPALSPPGTAPPLTPPQAAPPLDPLAAPGAAPAAPGPIRSRPLDLGTPPAGDPAAATPGVTPPATAPAADPLPSPAAPAGSGASLGITVVPLSDEARALYGLSVRRGALITQVRQGSAADRAGLPVGGLIATVDGRRIDAAEDLVAFVRGARPGQEVELGYYEGNVLQRKLVKLTPTAVGMAPPPAAPGPSAGILGGGERPLINRVERAVEGFAGGRGPTTVYDPSQMALLQTRVSELMEQVRALEERIKVLEGRGGGAAAPPAPAPALGGFTPMP